MDKVVVGVATTAVMEKAMEATTMTEGKWEDSPATQGLGQDRGKDTPGAAT